MVVADAESAQGSAGKAMDMPSRDTHRKRPPLRSQRRPLECRAELSATDRAVRDAIHAAAHIVGHVECAVGPECHSRGAMLRGARL